MRIATYNVEWFNSLFDDDGRLLNDQQWSGRQDVSREQQIAALVLVFRALNADAIMVIEAPDTSRSRDGRVALEAFAEYAGIRSNKALIGFANDTQQEIMLLYDKLVLSARHDPSGRPSGPDGSNDAPRFDSVFRYDINTDAAPDLIRWSKPPLEIEATTGNGRTFRMIGVHAKSKVPHGARNANAAMRLSIENRQKQLAQCIWLRQRIDQVLAAGDDLIVLGDLNDGPGLDEYEKLFGQSSIEILLGEGREHPLFDPHAKQAISRRGVAAPTTSRFQLPPDGRYLSALLDYIMVSPKLAALQLKWHIWHPFDDPACYRAPELRDALLTASDHFPVTLDIDL